MQPFKIQIDTILPGWGVSEYFITKGQFQNSIGIDPEMPRTDTGTRPSGLLRPTTMTKIGNTGDCIDVPLWFLTNGKDSNLYVYGNSGQVYIVNSGLTSITELNSGNILSASKGNGAEYYNNYVYFAKNLEVARYGPLSGTPAFDEDWWTSSPLSKTALANTTYPSINGIELPNHPMHVHPANNRLYFGDVDSDGVGLISMIKTKKGTYEGDTDDTVIPSAYKVLDFYYGWYPTCIESLGTELAIGIIDGINTGVKQGNAKVLFWSTLASDTSYNRAAILPDPLITAMKNVNGQLYVFSGSASGGMRISRYLGGETFEELYYADDQYPPFPGAVDCLINRLVWGASTTSPTTSASVMALGSKVRAFSMGVHNILKTTSSGTSPIATALKYFKQGPTTQPIVAWKDSARKGIDKIGTTYSTNVWRSQVYPLGQKGIIKNIRIPFAVKIAANMTVTVKVYIDDASSNTTVKIINNTNCSDTERFVNIDPNIVFDNNFFIELTWSGTALFPIALPIIISGNLLTDY